MGPGAAQGTETGESGPLSSGGPQVPCRDVSHPGTTCLLSCRVIRREHGDPLIEELNPGDALEPEGRGTGEGTWGLQPSLLCLCSAPAQDEGKRARAASSRGLGESLGAPGWKEGSQRSVWGSGNPWAVGSLAPGRDRKERLRVLQSDPSPLGIQSGVRERALERESQASVLALPHLWSWKRCFAFWVLPCTCMERIMPSALLTSVCGNEDPQKPMNVQT